MTKQEIQDLLSIISLCADRLGPNQVKELYRIAIFLGFAPKCPGCDMPISNIGDFSWDHIWPKTRVVQMICIIYNQCIKPVIH